jgi:hypothetical protein
MLFELSEAIAGENVSPGRRRAEFIHVINDDPANPSARNRVHVPQSAKARVNWSVTLVKTVGS